MNDVQAVRIDVSNYSFCLQTNVRTTREGYLSTNNSRGNGRNSLEWQFKHFVILLIEVLFFGQGSYSTDVFNSLQSDLQERCFDNNLCMEHNVSHHNLITFGTFFSMPYSIIAPNIIA